MKFPIIVVSILISITLFFSASVSAQRDFLTAEEVELIRDAQEIDRRIDVLTQAIDRRFHVLNMNVSAPKVKAKGDWGDLPQGTRAQLLLDIRRLLQKAVDDIDSLAERPESAILPDPDAKKKERSSFATLFPKAVRNLAAAAERYTPALKSELDATTDNSEKGSILGALELCSDIIASIVRLPPEPPKKGGKRT